MSLFIHSIVNLKCFFLFLFFCLFWLWIIFFNKSPNLKKKNTKKKTLTKFSAQKTPSIDLKFKFNYKEFFFKFYTKENHRLLSLKKLKEEEVEVEKNKCGYMLSTRLTRAERSASLKTKDSSEQLTKAV